MYIAFVTARWVSIIPLSFFGPRKYLGEIQDYLRNIIGGSLINLAVIVFLQQFLRQA